MGTVDTSLARRRQSRSLAATLTSALRREGVPPELLEPAVAELAAVSDPQKMGALFLEALRAWRSYAIEVSCILPGDCPLCGRWYDGGSVHACIGPEWPLARSCSRG